MNYKVLITSTGLGSRLGELTKDTNKSLIEIGGKTIISHIVDLYPKDIEIVVTLGYFGEKVEKSLVANHPDRKFTFVYVEKYQGLGSSLGYSMLQAKDKLKSPFIFHCNDTLVKTTPPSPQEENWNGGSLGNNPEIYNTVSYSSYSVDEQGYVKEIFGKGAAKYDLFHIGLVGFKDYQSFWKNLEDAYNENPDDSSLNDVVSIKKMISQGVKFKSVEFKDWEDTGNLVSLANANKVFGDEK